MFIQRFCSELRVNCRFCVQRISKVHTRVDTRSDLKFKDPSEKLQEYLNIPLFKENEKVFHPSIEEMKSASTLFQPNHHHEIKFLKAFVKLEDAPKHTLPEVPGWEKRNEAIITLRKVAFIGESNVGKSSLLKAILSLVPGIIVKTSKTPGFTKTINFYTVGKKCCLVDVPGYGLNQPEHFVSSVESYIRRRPNLMKTFMLIDGKTGFSDNDQIALDMLEEFHVPYAFVFTKIDTATISASISNLMKWKEIRDKQTTPSCFPQPFLVSSTTGYGLGFLMAFIAHITGNFNIKNN